MGLAAAQNGLAERRVMKDFADNHLPALVQEIRAACGFDIEVEMDWESLHYQGAHSSYWIENFKKVYFEPAVASFKSICGDDMGRDALKAKFNKIKFCNTDGRYHSSCSVSGNTLVFDHSPESNVDYVNDRTKEMTAFLEQNL